MVSGGTPPLAGALGRLSGRLSRTVVRSGVRKPDLDVVVVSSGSPGTAKLLRLLSPHLAVNSVDSYDDGLKHLDSPVHPALRAIEVPLAIHLVVDPREAVLSFFSSGRAAEIAAKLTSQHHTALGFGMHVRRHRDDALTLEGMLASGSDPFGLVERWHNWMRDDAPFPILTVQYAHLGEATPAILDFVGLPTDLAAPFADWRPAPSRYDEQPETVRRGLDAIYGDLAAALAAASPWSVRSAQIASPDS